jgi:HEAT repeat protein
MRIEHSTQSGEEMYPTKRNLSIALIVILAVYVASLSPLSAQTPEQLAWSALSAGASDKSSSTRAIAVRSLGLVNRDPAAEKLALDALHDHNAEVRAAAATALGHMGAKSAIPALKAAIRDPDVGVILAAASSLKRLGDSSAYLVYYAILTGQRKSGGGLIDEEKKMLSDPKKVAQFAFETGIGFVPFGGLSYGVLKTLTKDDISPIRAAAAVSIAHDPDPASGEALLRAAYDDSWIVRAAALDAIAQRGDPELIVGIMRALADQKAEVQYTAAAAIYHLSKIAESKGH